MWQETSWLVRERKVTSRTKTCFTKHWCDKRQVDWWGSEKWQVGPKPVPRNFLLDLSPVTFSAIRVTTRVGDARPGKMTTANKLVVLQKKKEETSFFFLVHFWMISQKNCEKWKEVTKLAESLGLVTGTLWHYFRDSLLSNWRNRTPVSKKCNLWGGVDRVMFIWAVGYSQPVV